VDGIDVLKGQASLDEIPRALEEATLELIPYPRTTLYLLRHRASDPFLMDMENKRPHEHSSC